MGRLLGGLFVGIILFSSLVIATSDSQNVVGNLLPIESTKVAYLYRDSFRIDPNIAIFFNSMGLGVDLIRETTLPRDLSVYKFVYIGDENFLRTQFLDFENLKTVVVNYHNLEDFGLSDSDGASQMGSSRPLGVITEGTDVQVYTSAFSSGRIAVPYYFVDVNNDVNGFTSVATTRPAASGNNFGDVVFYGDAGMTLGDGSVLNQKTCYFGIAKSGFWTNGAREIFRDCVDFVVG